MAEDGVVTGLEIALRELTRRLPHIELVPGQPWEYSPNTSHRGVEHVLVTWDPARNPREEDHPAGGYHFGHG